MMDKIIVILFVRMWVEISYRFAKCVIACVILFVRMWVEILVGHLKMKTEICHPLREDVSWNISCMQKIHEENVILFVRMWVEICSGWSDRADNWVILFVRMWVEISMMVDEALERMRSSSSWECELKWCWIRSCWCKLPSSSSWRCELKSWRVRC